MSYDSKIEPGTKVQLKDYDPDENGNLTKDEALPLFDDIGKDLEELEEILYAAAAHGVLIVLQGIDTSGKDGTIRNLLRYVNVQSTRVQPFKVPTDLEVAHDFLWRVHKEVPPKGGVTIFNRSHYEDVLAVRVHNLVPEKVWRKRYEMINNFEYLLAESGTIILKFFLHISKDEQKKRLLEREADPVKAWKLSPGDWQEREHWDDYVAAYEDALEKCSTEHAPWHIVPANRKWFRNLAVIDRVAKTLRPLKSEWLEKLEGVAETAKLQLENYRKEHQK